MRILTSCPARPLRVFWNGIFAAGDWRAKKGPEVDVSAQRPEIGDHHAREIAAKNDETIEDDRDDEDSTIIADEEEGDEDVTDIIGDVRGDEEA